MKIVDKLSTRIIKNKYYQYAYFIAFFFILLATTILFYPLHEGHDLNFHFIRFDALIGAIRDGSFPVYIDYQSINGYGYAPKWFYSDFVLIPFAYLALYTDIFIAYKIMLIFYTLLCGWISYISANKIFKNNYIAFIFCILYTFSYYRLYDIYNRGALGEAICLTFIPLAIWGTYEIIKGNYKKWYIITIAYALMILSHVNTPVIVAFISIFFFLFFYKSFLKKPIRLAYLGLAVTVTILLTAYFIFPFIEQLLSNDFYFALTNEKAITFPVQNGEPIKYIIRGLFSGMTYVVPEIAGVGIVITICCLLRIFLEKDQDIKKGDIFLLIGLISLLIISPLYPWKIFPFNIIGFIQFSWRFYTISTILLAVAGAVYFYKSFRTGKKSYLVGIPAIVVLTILVISNSGQVFTNERGVFDGHNRNSEGLGIMGAEYLPQNIPNKYSFFENRANDSIRSIYNNSSITNFKRELRTISFDVATNKDELELPLVYYKGYTAELTPNRIYKVKPMLEIKQSENGLIQIPINESGHVKVYFGGTLIQNVSPYITLAAILLMIGYIVWYNRKSKNEK